jgi:hypothetical protein
MHNAAGFLNLFPFVVRHEPSRQVEHETETKSESDRAAWPMHRRQRALAASIKPAALASYNCSHEKFVTPEQTNESRITAENLEVGILAQAIQVLIAQLEGPLQRGKGRVDHPQDGVTASQVVPGDRVFRNQPNQPAVKLKCPRVLTFGGQIVRLDPDGLDKVWVAF